MKQPINPKESIYHEIHHKRVKKIIPECIFVFERFFRRLSEFQFSVAAYIIDTDSAVSLEKDQGSLQRLAYKSMAKWFKMLDNDYELIICLIHENCITKNADELLGFWLSELFIIKEIHMEHSKAIPKAGPIEVEDELYK
jgi:hypothetical protein